MKKRLLIVAGVILVVALAFGMGFWKEAQATNQKMEHILDLSRILTLAENRGSDWAADELMINEIETFSKKNLYKKWGNPTESAEGAKEDIWILSEQFRLIVDYDELERPFKWSRVIVKAESPNNRSTASLNSALFPSFISLLIFCIRSPSKKK